MGEEAVVEDGKMSTFQACNSQPLQVFVNCLEPFSLKPCSPAKHERSRDGPWGAQGPPSLVNFAHVDQCDAMCACVLLLQGHKPSGFEVT